MSTATLAKELGYQTTHTKRGVRMYRAGGRFVLFSSESAARTYLKKVQSVRAKQAKEGETNGKTETNQMERRNALPLTTNSND